MGTAIYFGLMFAIIFAAIAMLFQQGLWSNTITLINVVIGGLVSFGLFSTVLSILVSIQPTYVFVFPLLSFWLTFVVVFLILQRGLTATLSKTRMKFIPQLDSAGGILMSVAVGVTLCSYTFATLHYAPLPIDMMSEHFAYDPAKVEVYEHIDLAWIHLATAAGDNDCWGTSSLDKLYQLPNGKIAQAYVGFGLVMRAVLQTQKDLRVDVKNKDDIQKLLRRP